MKTTNLSLLGAGMALALCAPGVSAQSLFSDNFEVNSSAGWKVNTAGTGSDATFAFNYGALGIPSAPNSGGTTSGLKLRGNQFGSTATFPGGVSVSPIGYSFAGDYSVRFDMWLNFNGPAPAGGSGSTQITGFGIGTAGNTAQVAGGVIDSINFGTTVDGQSSVDYRAYAPAAQTGYTAPSGVFAAGIGTSPDARNNSHPYYAGFGGVSAPAAQLALYGQQTGTTAVGSLGFGWHDVELIKSGTSVKWYVDDLLIATVSTTVAGTLGGGNILLSHYDSNATVSTDALSPDLLFGLIDNLQVTVVPEPSTVALALLGGAGLLVIRRRK